MSTSGGTRSSTNVRGGRGGAPKQSAAERNAAEIAALHTASRDWQARNASAPKEVQPVDNSKVNAIWSQITPIKTGVAGFELNPAAPIPLHPIVEAFGGHQVGTILHSFNSMAKLREVADVNGISKGGSKVDLISRITAAATHGHYSADFGTAKAKSANTPAAQHAARISKIDAQIARLQAQREQLVRQGPGYKAPARSASPRSQRAYPDNYTPHMESALRQLNDPTSAHEALTKLAGGDIARLQAILRFEPIGVTVRMLSGLGGKVPRQTSKPGHVQADNLARLIAERLRAGA